MDRAERGQELAADLAAVHNATLAEIADILDICCSDEAAELLNYRGPGLLPFAYAHTTRGTRRDNRSQSKPHDGLGSSRISPGTSCNRLEKSRRVGLPHAPGSP